MTRGRKPISNELKALRGTLQPCRTKTGLSGNQLDSVPAPPDYLSDQAKFIFVHACDILIIKGRLFEEDIPLVCAYANEYATFQMAVEKLQGPDNHIQTSNSGYEQISPWVTVKNQSLKNLQSIGANLGFDPISRMRFNSETKQESELQKFLKEFEDAPDEQFTLKTG